MMPAIAAMATTAALTYGSVCSGIEAASVAWHGLGWQPAWFAEIEDFPSKVLAHRFPNVRNLGDMTKIAAMVRAGAVAAPDVLVGGTPCQAFSFAGLRQSLDDARGQLSLAFVGLANEIDTARSVRGERPAIVVWENVPGVLSTKDNAFGCFLGALAGDDDPISAPVDRRGRTQRWPDAGVLYGPQRAVAWRVMDAQYFGVAQRRRRVFVCAVGYSDQGVDPARILFEFQGQRRDSCPERKARADITAAITARFGASGAGATDGEAGHLIPVDQGVAATLEAASSRSRGAGTPVGMLAAVPAPEGFRMRAFGDYAGDGTASTMKARDFKDATDLIVQPEAAYGFQPRIARNGRGDMGMVCSALTAQAGETGKGDASPHVAYAFAENSRAEVRLEGGDGQIAGALSTGGGKPGQGYPVVAYGLPGNWIGRAPENGGNATEPMVDVSPCLTKMDRHAVADCIAFSAKDYGADATQELSPTLRAGGFTGSHANGGVMPAVAYRVGGDGDVWQMGDQTAALTTGTDRTANIALCFKPSHYTRGKDGAPSEIFPPLTREADKGDQEALAYGFRMAVRRLMPVECERLQGFPDGWTWVPVRQLKQPRAEALLAKGDRNVCLIDGQWWQMSADGPRYKALGNSMATPCMLFIGQGIAAELARCNPVVGEVAA